MRIMVVAGLLGVLAAVVGTYALNGIVARAEGRTDAYADMVVAVADLGFGSKLEPAMLRVVRVPREALPDGAFASVDSVIGQTTKVFVGALEPVTSIKLSARGGGLSMQVPRALRAASVEVDRVSGVSGFVLPGDRVDVLVTVDRRGYRSDAVTRTLLQNVEVLAAGQKTSQEDGQPLTVQSVTVLVSPEGAEQLAHGQHEGRLHLVLRNPDDTGEVETRTFSTGDLLGRTAAPERPRTVTRTIPSAPAPPAGSDRVRMIRSATVSEVPAPVDAKGTL